MKRYTTEEKQAAVNDLKTMSFDEVSKKHGVSPASLSIWKRKLKNNSKQPGFTLRPEAKIENVDLELMLEEKRYAIKKLGLQLQDKDQVIEKKENELKELYAYLGKMHFKKHYEELVRFGNTQLKVSLNDELQTLEN